MKATSHNGTELEWFATEVFALQPGASSRHFLNRLTGRYWWALAVPLAVLYGLGLTGNDAWWYVALIFVFLVAPLFVFFAYFAATLNREAVEAVKPHTITLTPDGLVHTHYAVRASKELSAKLSLDKYTIYKSADGWEMMPVGTTEYALDNIVETVAEGEWLKISLKEPSGTAILIPRAAIIMGEGIG